MGDSGHILVPGINTTDAYHHVNITFTPTTTDVSTPVSSDFRVTSGPAGPPPPVHPAYVQAILCTVLGLIILGTILGNSLVCAAVALAKRLQSPHNLLIVSLAVSDGLVAVLVMPLATVYEVMGYFPLSKWACDIWTSLDVILCSASILNLCMISIDRYFCITKPFEYAPKRTPKRMAVMIAAVWCLSVILSVPPLFGWRAKHVQYHCSISQEIGYQIYATLGAFYVPLFVMIVIYFRIWKVSSRLVRKHKYKMGKKNTAYERSSVSSGVSETTSVSRNGFLKNGINNNESVIEKLPLNRSASKSSSKHRFSLKPSLSSGNKNLKKKREKSSSDRRATKTLGIIMGGFTLCWLPFFILAVIRPFLDPEAIPPWLSFCLVWLGYFNSFLNPLIYARFNREFRTPFKLILTCSCHGINRRLRSESYVEQYGPDAVYRDHDVDSFRIKHRQIARCTSLEEVSVQLENGHSSPSTSTNCIRESIV